MDLLEFDDYDKVVCHDLMLLPMVCETFSVSDIILDAREYYPRQFEDSFFWQLTSGRLSKYIADHYLDRIGGIVTVSEGIAQEYRRLTSRPVRVVFSMADGGEPGIRETTSPIRVVHHGNSNPNRNLRATVNAFAELQNVTLDLFLHVTDHRELERLRVLTSAAPNVNLLPELPYPELMERLRDYDIGIYHSPPSTFNLRHSMPNKVFEYLQARLALLVSPLEDVAKFVREHDIGFVTSGFDDESLAVALRSLDRVQIDRAKKRSDRLASEMDSGEFGRQFFEFLRSI